MKMKWLWIGAVAMLCAVLTAAVWAVNTPGLGQEAGGAQGMRQGRKPPLTPEQREELKAKVKEMKEEGASGEEIREALKDMLNDWDIELPQGNRVQKNVRARLSWLAKQLTPEQRQELKAKVEEMKDEGASGEEIHAAIKQMLDGWGIEAPRAAAGQALKTVLAQLTPEQRQELKAKVEEMKDEGASGEEIRAAIKQMLDGWGIEAPRAAAGQALKTVLAQLTPEQRQELKAKVKEMKEEGASGEEIHAAIKQMLDGWGIEVPQGNRVQRNVRARLSWLAKQLTPEQRQELKARVTAMKDEGASREEIHAAVQEMLKAWDVEVPQGCHSSPAAGCTGER